MTIRLIGALFIFGGCSTIGFSIALQSKKEENMLHQIVWIIEFLSCELQFHLSALPDLFREAANSVSGELRSFCISVAKGLDAQTFSSASECINHILVENMSFPSRVRKILEQMAISMGRFDLPGQISNLESARSACEKELHYLERNRDERMRSYRTLGLCAGAALAIILF